MDQVETKTIAQKPKRKKLIESIRFWRNAGVTPKYLGVVIFNNFVAKGLGGIGIGLLIPLANGVIKEDFSLLTNSSIFVRVSKVFPAISDFSNMQLFFLLSILILTLNILKSIINYALDVYQKRRNLKITSNITRTFFREQISLGKVFLDDTNGGTYAFKMSRTPVQIGQVLESFGLIVGSITEIIVYAVILLYISPAIFFMAMPLIPILLVSILFIKKRIKALALSELEGDVGIAKGFYNSIIRTPLIRIYNTESEEIDAFNELCLSFEDKKLKMRKITGFIKPVQDITIFTALFLVVLILRFYSSISPTEIGVASLLVFFVTFRQMLGSASSVVMPLVMIPYKMTVVDSVKKQLEEHSTQNEIKGNEVFRKLKDSITCKDLDFGYKANNTILNGLSCVIPQGKTTAIVGKSGSGKTTLVNLILKLYNVPKNSIFFDGVDVNEFTEKSIRNPFSYVSQDILLFDDTLRNNICYGLKEAPSDERLIKIIEEVNLTPLVKGLDKGLDTEIGDRGVQLSGGERQRVALARALLNESSIIIFDEPTSSVDIETELEILGLIKKYSEGRTIIIIAHSFLTIQHADHVIMIENGKTTEEGSIQDLIDNQNVFYKFWKSQMWDKGGSEE